MINVDLRRYGTDEEYRKMINGFVSGADFDEKPIEIQMDKELKGLRGTMVIDEEAFNAEREENG